MTLHGLKALATLQFAVAFSWIAFHKCVQIVCAFLGLYGNIPKEKLVPVIPLLFGGDVWSAFWVSLFTTLLLLAFAMAANEKITFMAAVTLQAILALLGVVSVYLTVTVGSPLDKTVIDIVRLQAEQGSALSFMDSLLRHLSLVTIAFIVATLGLGVFASLWLRSKSSSVLSRSGKCWFPLVALAVFHVTLLPGFKSRKLTGEQLRTWGLDRSFPHDLVLSYGSSLLTKVTKLIENKELQFYFDLTSPTVSSFMEAPPINGANPLDTNLMVIILESVGAVYFQDEPELMPFFTIFPNTVEGMVTLDHHYTTWPQTTNALFSIFCSEFPHPGADPISVVNPSIPCECLSTTLKKAGYRTALFTSQDITFDATHRLLQGRDFDVIYDIGTMPQSDGSWRQSWGLDDSVTLAASLRWAVSQPDRPFFVAVQLVSGHHPYQVPPDHDEKNQNATNIERYKQSLRYLNTILTDFFKELDVTGLAENTLVLIVSDHGESFGQHPGDFTHGPTIWETAVRVPALLFGPQLRWVTTHVVSEPTSHIDLAPTLLALLGLEIPSTMKGRDLTSSREHRLVMMGSRPPAAQFGLRDGPYKFIWTLETDLIELFDLTNDPFELVNIAPAHPDLVAVYSDIVRRWRTHTKYLIENYAEVAGQRLGWKPQ